MLLGLSIMLPLVHGESRGISMVHIISDVMDLPLWRSFIVITYIVNQPQGDCTFLGPLQCLCLRKLLMILTHSLFLFSHPYYVILSSWLKDGCSICRDWLNSRQKKEKVKGVKWYISFLSFISSLWRAALCRLFSQLCCSEFCHMDTIICLEMQKVNICSWTYCYPKQNWDPMNKKRKVIDTR